ncbi:MAG TPA: tetratricopeptide repeat protein [Chloroflexota bacterium]|nr:tetratricopeptide repeat protein [Chloroflexota bacterium]
MLILGILKVIAEGAGATEARRRRTAGAISAALAISVLTLYAQTRRFEFINLDDYHFLVNNPMVTSGLTWDGLWWAMLSVEADWHPLTWLSHMLDFSVFGPDPGPQHLVNAGLHAANGVLLFLALRALSGAPWPSALAAALFALHPLRAESVAWLVERKDVLSGLFWMLSLLAYAAFARRPSAARYALVGAAIVLGLMSKSMLVSLPVVLLLLDFWPLERVRLAHHPLPESAAGRGPAAAGADARSPLPLTRLVLEKLPLITLSAAAAGLTLLAQQSMGAFRSLDQVSTAWRVVNAPLAYSTYLYQTLWPTRLAAFYPHPAMIAGTPLGNYRWLAAGATALLATVTVLCVRAARRRPYLLVGWLWYLLTLVPVVGLVQVGQQSHADRYTYLPVIGVCIMVAWGLRDAIARWPRLRVPAVSGSALVLIGLTVLSWRQIGTWQNSRRLFEHAIAVTHDNYYAQQTLGNALIMSGELEPARRHLEEALRIKPDSAYALEQLGVLFEQQGNRGAAAEAYEKAVRLSWKSMYARYHLASIRRAEGKLDAAIELWTAALQYQPDDPQLRFDLGAALLQQQRYAEAIVQLRRLTELAPDVPDAHNVLGVALAQQGRLDDAAAQFEQTLALNPGHPDATRNLQWVRAQGRTQTLGH